LNKNNSLDSLRSISLNKFTPFKTWIFKNNSLLIKLVIRENKFKESYNVPRQMLKSTYSQNAVYDIFKTKLLKKNVINGKKIYGLITNDHIDIDNLDDLKKLNKEKRNFIKFNNYISK